MTKKYFDVAVIGGGLLGSSFAYGFGQAGLSVALIDEGDNAIRTARGNFGLVWVQGKGEGMREYARWSRKSADGWLNFSDQLSEVTGQDLGYHQSGGFNISLDEAELEEYLRVLES